MIDIGKIRAQFPAINNHPEVIYFDSATTTQKPRFVLDAILDYHHSYCSSFARSAHDWGIRTTHIIEQTRKNTAAFLGLDSPDGLFFTSGATDGSNQLSLYFCEHYLNDDDQIIVSKDEHKTLLSAWQRAINITRKKIAFNFIELDPEGDYDIGDLKNKLTPKTRLVILSHIHNVFGIEMGIKEARKAIPFDVPIILDATQSIGHIPVKPRDLGVQAIYYSGHKMFGFSGIGALWIDEKYRSKMVPFEQGTPNIEGIISLGAAMQYIEDIGIENIENHLLDLTQYALQKLQKIPDLEFLPGPAFCRCATGHGILSFRKKGVSSQDIAHWLNEHRIYVRSGDHCSDSEKANDSVRLSFQIYNERKEIDRLTDVLREI